jgi:hypothetical protein
MQLSAFARLGIVVPAIAPEAAPHGPSRLFTQS